MSASKTLNRWGIYALLLGICAGIFFGDLTRDFLTPFGHAFSMLLQMAVFPYICLSVVLGLATIPPNETLRLLKRGLPFIAGFWILSIFYLSILTWLIPAPFPPLIHAEVGHAQKDAMEFILEYLSPENGLYALAENMILPGLAFSLFFGAALKYTDKKEFLVPYLEKSLLILERIFRWLRIISPIGVFIYIAIAFGSIELGDVQKIIPYLTSRTITSLFIALLIIPLIVLFCVNITKTKLFKAIGEICLLPFLSGSPALVIPFLVLYRSHLGFAAEDRAELDFRDEEGSGGQLGSPALQLIIPIAFCVGQIGASVVIFLSSFICFYYRISMSLIERIIIFFHFVPISFGDPTAAFSAPYFLGHFNLPITSIRVDEEIALIIHHFTILMSAVSIFAIVILGYAAYSGTLRIRWKWLVGSITALSILFVAAVSIAEPLIHMKNYYEGIYQNLKLSDAIKYPVSSKLLPLGDAGTARDPSKPTFQQIIQSGIIKIGIEIFEIPYSYYNNAGELVGYDISFAYQLARDLDCSIEFIQADANNLGEQLNSGYFDIGMSSFLMTENRLRSMEFSQPSYKEEDNILIVPRNQKNEFLDLKTVQSRPMKILTGGAYSPIAQKHFPNAEIISEFGPYSLKEHKVDACFWARTSGFVWCILNPDFVVIDYGLPLGRSHLAYPVKEDALEFVAFLDNWIKIKEQLGFKQKMIEYWIEGQQINKEKTRWSVVKDVLHLVE